MVFTTEHKFHGFAIQTGSNFAPDAIKQRINEFLKVFPNITKLFRTVNICCNAIKFSLSDQDFEIISADFTNKMLISEDLFLENFKIYVSF